ncbi:MAG: EscU/YscU/HrcU family type III secretion system export apparatus switch protein [bacterium]
MADENSRDKIINFPAAGAEENKKKDGDRKSAIAVRYDVDQDRAPHIIATGKGSIAEEIVRVAEENGIPLYEDKPLAEMLTKLELDTEIPPDLYVLVAEVLFFVYKLDRMAEKREKIMKKMEEDKKSAKRP